MSMRSPLFILKNSFSNFSLPHFLQDNLVVILSPSSKSKETVYFILKSIIGNYLKLPDYLRFFTTVSTNGIKIVFRIIAGKE